MHPVGAGLCARPSPATTVPVGMLKPSAKANTQVRLYRWNSVGDAALGVPSFAPTLFA